MKHSAVAVASHRVYCTVFLLAAEQSRAVCALSEGAMAEAEERREEATARGRGGRASALCSAACAREDTESNRTESNGTRESEPSGAVHRAGGGRRGDWRLWRMRARRNSASGGAEGAAAAAAQG